MLRRSSIDFTGRMLSVRNGCDGGRLCSPSISTRLRDPRQKFQIIRRASATDNNNGLNSTSVFEIERFQKHQANSRRMSHAEEARTLVKNGHYGVLSTLSKKNGGHPCGSIVNYASEIAEADATNEQKNELELVFAFSSLSPHTADILVDNRFSLTIAKDTFRGVSDARVSISGTMELIDRENVELMEKAKATFMSKHPDAFWVDFGDFRWFRMITMVDARLVGGFARAGLVKAPAYFGAAADPVSKFAKPVCDHMNADHSDATMLMIRHAVGLDVDSAEIVSLDRYGMDVQSSRSLADGNKEDFKLRLPFPSEAKTRKDLKDLIVQMTKEAQGS